MSDLTQEGLAARGMDEPWKSMTDWSGLPDVYVTKAECQQGMFWRVEACSVPMAIGPEVRLISADRVAVLIREAEARGMERAAKLVDKRAEEYDREFGIYDYTTGVTEYPGTGDESMEEWESISAAIRAAAAALRKDEEPK